jgi:hypothetical protein
MSLPDKRSVGFCPPAIPTPGSAPSGAGASPPSALLMEEEPESADRPREIFALSRKPSPVRSLCRFLVSRPARHRNRIRLQVYYTKSVGLPSRYPTSGFGRVVVRRQSNRGSSACAPKPAARTVPAGEPERLTIALHRARATSTRRASEGHSTGPSLARRVGIEAQPPRIGHSSPGHSAAAPAAGSGGLTPWEPLPAENQGSQPVSNQKSRARTRSSSLRSSATTVARPVGVVPTICFRSLDHRKCRSQTCLRG